MEWAVAGTADSRFTIVCVCNGRWDMAMSND